MIAMRTSSLVETTREAVVSMMMAGTLMLSAIVITTL
jgi:hypothetical protein